MKIILPDGNVQEAEDELRAIRRNERDHFQRS